jgi:hypothetical protein
MILAHLPALYAHTGQPLCSLQLSAGNSDSNSQRYLIGYCPDLACWWIPFTRIGLSEWIPFLTLLYRKFFIAHH